MNWQAQSGANLYDADSHDITGSLAMIIAVQKNPLRDAADALISATNTLDVARVQALFATDAVIDDPSTGHCFHGHAGIRDYVERYFIGYHTVTRFLSMRDMNARTACVRVDFTGDFGHEIGLLSITLDAEGYISRIDASLE